MSGICGQVFEGIAPILDDPLFLLLVGHDARVCNRELERILVAVKRHGSGVEKDAKDKRISGGEAEKRLPLVANVAISRRSVAGSAVTARWTPQNDFSDLRAGPIAPLQ